MRNLGCLIAVLVAVAACSKTRRPPPPVVITVQEIVPTEFNLESPQAFEIRGSNFGPVGDSAQVAFIATVGTPFLGGTLGRIEVTGLIFSQDTITGTIALPGVSEPTQVTVMVILPDGVERMVESTDPVILSDSSLDPPRILEPAIYLDLDGDGNPGTGDAVVIRFDREVVVTDATVPEDLDLAPEGDFGAGAIVVGPGPAVPPEVLAVVGTDPNWAAVVLGPGAGLKTRQTWDPAGTGDNLPSGLLIDASPGITNTAGKDPTHGDGEDLPETLDIVPGFVPGAVQAGGDTRDVLLVDLNTDGWLDLVTIDLLGNHRVYFNGSGGLGGPQPLTIFRGMDQQVADFAQAAAAGDLDGDGDVDLVIARTGGADWVLRRRSDGTFDLEAELGLADTTDVALGDIDCDGNLDIVTANEGGGARIYRNNGESGNRLGFVDTEIRLERGLDNRSVALVDYDRDGDLDILLGNIGPNSLWRNVSTPGEIRIDPTTVRNGAARTYGVAVGDVDGDGDLDYVAANFQAQAQAWLQEAGDFVPGASFGDATGDSRVVALSDIDSDGDLDAVLGTAFASTTVWLNDGFGVFVPTGQRMGDARVRGLALGDLDRDGDTDLVIGNAGAPDRVWRNSLSGTWGGARFRPANPPLPAPLWTADAALGLDRIATGDATGRNEVWDFTNLTLVRKLAGVAVRGLAIGDLAVDGGEPDVALCHAGGVDIDWGDGGTPTALLTAGDCEAVAVADVDGANGDDIVVARNGQVEVWSNDGSGGFTPTSISEPGTLFVSVLAADLDGDGEVDLAAGHAGGVTVWLNGAGAVPSAPAYMTLGVPGGVHALAAANVNERRYDRQFNAASADTDVSVTAPNRFNKSGGWDETPVLAGDTIQVSGFGTAANNGTFTVASASGSLITITGSSLTTEAAGNAVTIRVTQPTLQPVVDLVTAGADVRVWSNTQTLTTQALDYGLSVLAGSAAPTDVAAGAGAVVASGATGLREWTGPGGGPVATPGPHVDALAGDPNGGLVSMRTGIGHDVDGAAFGNAKDTVVVADLDADGEPELVITESDGANRVWRADAGGYVDAGTVGEGFAAVCDVDRDGSPDLVTADADYRGARLWINDGAGAFTAGSELLPGEAVRGAFSADVSGDGCNELVLLTGTGVHVLGGDGFTTLAAVLPVAHDVALGDAGQLVLATSRIEVWKVGSATPLSTIVDAGVRTVAVADIDADGRADIVSAGRGRPIRVISSSDVPKMLATAWVEALRLRDVDGDGRLDLVAGVFGDRNGIVRDVRGSGALTDDFGGLWTEALALSDLDRDGDTDIVVRSRESDAPDVKRNE